MLLPSLFLSSCHPHSSPTPPHVTPCDALATRDGRTMNNGDDDRRQSTLATKEDPSLHECGVERERVRLLLLISDTTPSTVPSRIRDTQHILPLLACLHVGRRVSSVRFDSLDLSLVPHHVTKGEGQRGRCGSKAEMGEGNAGRSADGGEKDATKGE